MNGIIYYTKSCCKKKLKSQCFKWSHGLSCKDQNFTLQLWESSCEV